MMNNTNNSAVEVAEMKNQIAQLTKHIEMCGSANPYLKGCALSQNQARIAEASASLETLNSYVSLVERVGADEVDRCEAAAVDSWKYEQGL